VLAPTYSQIRAQAASIAMKDPKARVIGIHSAGSWTDDSARHESGEPFRIIQCDSPLAMRQAMQDTSAVEGRVVLITPLDNNAVPDDVRVRLARRKLHEIDVWQVVRALFRASTVDPRVVGYPWMAEQLLTLSAACECPAAPGAYLDLESTWAFLLAQALGLDAVQLDLVSLLAWSKESENVLRLKRLTPDFREAAMAWVVRIAGSPASCVFQCLLVESQPDAIAVGLAAQVVAHPKAKGQLDKAIGRLEAGYLGGMTLNQADAGRWGAAAVDFVRNYAVEDSALRKSDALLKELQADEYAWLSDVSPLGFDQRMARFGRALRDAIGNGVTAGIEAALASLREHHAADREKRRVAATEMALRLVRWLEFNRRAPSSQTESFSNCVDKYCAEDSFVDLARLTIRNGDAVAELSESYSELFREATRLQEANAEHFARLLKDWTAAGSASGDLMPVENVLDRIVAPLAARVPVLVVVLDGMSLPVYWQILRDIRARGWFAMCPQGATRQPPAIATIPSVTEFSRTSLLCGRLCNGDAAVERAGFTTHAGLLQASKTGKPPVIFHKATLQETDDISLSGPIRAEIANVDRRVVGVVVNAIDDHLLKGEQLNIGWNLDTIRVLGPLLYEAMCARRTVILLSDHGHVVETSTRFDAAEGGERWRVSDGRLERGEIQLTGNRVVTANGSITVPWTENLRYTMKKNGYHGGSNPQEMVAPIALLSPTEDFPGGWVEAQTIPPTWWDDKPIVIPMLPQSVAPKQDMPESLLDWREEDKDVQRVEVVAAPPAWLESLFDSAVFAEQKRLAGRSYPNDEAVLFRLVSALDTSGGKMTSTAIARVLEYPPLRLRGLLAVAQRVLNVDGYRVLGRDEDSDTVELNVELLKRQFGLE
jgi:hypothetical protein